MTIEVGATLPDATLYEGSPATKHQLSDLLKGKKVILFAVPGAFTPGCHLTHAPGYIADYDKFKAKGVDAILCVAVNDPFVMGAWGKSLNAEGKVMMLADPQGEFAKAIGCTIDSPALGGLRSSRYSMVVEDGVVKHLNLEKGGELTCSLSNVIMSQI